MKTFQKILLFVVYIVLLSIAVNAQVGIWEEKGKPYKIGTINEISIGYDAQDTRYVFAASISDSGWHQISMLLSKSMTS